MTHTIGWKGIAGAALLLLVSLFTAPPTGANTGFTHHGDVFGPNYDFHPQLTPPQFPGIVQRYSPPPGPDPLGRIRYWNQIMLNANALDHTPAEDSVPFGEQIGPARTSRAFAIVHIAIFDAVNAIMGRFESYTGIAPADRTTSLDAAIAKAAHDTLAALYPSQEVIFNQLFAEDLERIPDGAGKDDGIDTGRRAAEAILELRADDGSPHEEPVIGVDYFPSDAPGKWQPDPISESPLALGANWSGVYPFALKSADQFHAPPPPGLRSIEYAAAFREVKRLGGDGIATPTQRTVDQTIAGIYWSYDGTPGLGTPPRLYNQIAVQIAEQMGSDFAELARLLALVNVGMADGSIACWHSKYAYEFWRPVTAICRASEDRNPMTVPDLDWRPMGAQASNIEGPDFTPPFPAYTSGHAVLGGVLFQILRKFYKTDLIAFAFVSDELNGITRDNLDPGICALASGRPGATIPDRDCGRVRPRIPRNFSSLSEAEEENGQSRIYLGIHWRFDKTKGIMQGRRVADYVFENSFQPVQMPHYWPRWHHRREVH
ncbi:MAG: phosphatase PAP2 family protein [Deltaproteobacteria bacterium]|nr:phosphatase PAP2 family protein [Deltaproteobacteria bacterium]